MTIQGDDVKLLASKTPDDVPEGGGGPSGTVVPSGASNHVFTDVTSVDRAGGDGSIRQLHYHVQTPNTDRALDMYLMISRAPDDPAVEVTMVECDTFAQRTAIAAAVASYFIPASEWGGYLLEPHIKNQENITVLQRPGTTLPTVGRTMFLVYDEGMITERKQAIRIIKVAWTETTYTDMSTVPPTDFQALRITLSLDKGLEFDFPGSPPSRGFARSGNKTLIRDSMAAGASKFYGAAASTVASALTDDWIRVDSIYSQVVPSSRTPKNNPAERPGAQRTIVLATAPRRVEVGVTPHSARIAISAENVSKAYTLPPLRPLPEPGTIVLTYRSLGQKYQMHDDGAGNFVGTVGESGRIGYGDGLGDATLNDLPDIGSVFTIHWGERSAYTNRAGQGAQVRAPEYVWTLDNPGVVPGTFELQYTSANAVRTVTDDGNGNLAGDATGVIDYPSGSILMRPARMPDAGGEFSIDYQTDPLVTELLAAPAPDAGGFIQFGLAQQPMAKSLEVTWATARQVSETSGGYLTETSATKTVDVQYVWRMVPETQPAAPPGVMPPGTAFEQVSARNNNI